MISHYTPAHLLLFLVGVVVCLIVDLRAHGKDEAVSAASALRWSLFWIGLAMLFAVYIFATNGTDDAALFLAGYGLEKSLSVDNLFVIMAIVSSFAVKEEYLHRVLYYGIIGALVLRLVFVAAGTSLFAVLGPYAMTVFGIFVLWSAWKMWQESKKEHVEIEDYSNHWSVAWTRRFFPVHNKMSGHDFFVRVREGTREVRKATPLFLCLVVVEISDIMFAFDSVPAVIAITHDPFLVYTSNVFAILGLRSLYFLLEAAKGKLSRLNQAVIIILVYVGLKMLLDASGLLHLPPLVGLAVVVFFLSGGIAASYLWPAKERKD
ncbi:MAG: TerC/Alx family metal homeostasis membrane protein [Desulfovibrio sp.]|jgi:tellurite resistance protein TerC|nr:TerC/Alx family metal homeostasis membrane protein [Desulfovibrio sp.]